MKFMSLILGAILVAGQAAASDGRVLAVTPASSVSEAPETAATLECTGGQCTIAWVNANGVTIETKKTCHTKGLFCSQGQTCSCVCADNEGSLSADNVCS